MKELIVLNVGGAGVRIGDKIWQTLLKEHHIDASGFTNEESNLFNNQTICRELSSGKHIPRNLFIDTSPEVVDELRAGARNKLYNPAYSITGKEDSSNNYIKGHHTIGKHLSDECENKFIKLLQGCDHLNGVLLNCSMSGGTGSGLTNLLLDRLITNNTLKKKQIGINLVLPSPHQADTVVEPYNFIMALGEMVGFHVDKYVVGFDNEQLHHLCEGQGIEEPAYNEINSLIARFTAIMTSPFRVRSNPGQLSEIITNSIPYQRAFLLNPTLAQTNNVVKINQTIESLYRPSSTLNSYRSLGNETIFSSHATIRGEIGYFEGLNSLISAKRDLKFSNWNPTNLKLRTSTLPTKANFEDNVCEGVMLLNSESCRRMLDMQHKRFDKLYQKRSFIHWYVGEGVDDDYVNSGREETAGLEKDYEEMAIDTVVESDGFIYE